MPDRPNTAARPAATDPAASAPTRARPGPSTDFDRARLLTILRTLPDPVWLKDPDGVYLACNPRFEALRGRSEAEIVGHRAEELVPDRIASVLANDRRAVETGGPITYEEWMTFADGHRELVETIKTPMYADDGSLIGVLGIARDITAMRAAEEALREQEETFEAIVSQSADAMALIDAETRGFLQFNDAACEGLGYTREEFARLRVEDIDGSDPPLDMGQIGRELQQSRTVRLSARHRDRDGFLRDVDVSLRPLQLRGRSVGASVWRDVTEDRRRAAALAESEAALRRAQGALIAEPAQAADGVRRRGCLDHGPTRRTLARIVEANGSALAALGQPTSGSSRPISCLRPSPHTHRPRPSTGSGEPPRRAASGSSGFGPTGTGDADGWT